MKFEKIGALTIAVMVGAGTILGHDEEHIEQRPTTPEPALPMDAVIISTATVTDSGTPKLIAYMRKEPPVKLFDFGSFFETNTIGISL
jgi:hypothetical protein